MIQKVVAYITWDRRLLVFRQPAFPEAGVQVPAGTMEEGERPESAVLREAEEETGLEGLSVVSLLGSRDYLWPYYRDGQTVVRRHYFHLRFEGEAPERWTHCERTPSEGSEEAILFELWWVELESELPILHGDLGDYLERVLVMDD